MTNEEVIKIIQNPQVPIKDLSSALGWLSGEYAFYASRLQEILTVKPNVWNGLRIKCQSDKQAERLWQASDSGIEEMNYRQNLKTFEKLISTVKVLIKIRQEEFNQSNY